MKEDFGVWNNCFLVVGINNPEADEYRVVLSRTDEPAEGLPDATPLISVLLNSGRMIRTSAANGERLYRLHQVLISAEQGGKAREFSTDRVALQQQLVLIPNGFLTIDQIKRIEMVFRGVTQGEDQT